MKQEPRDGAPGASDTEVDLSFYSKFAEHYEKVFPFRPPTLAFLNRYLPAESRLLDLGCGSGHYCGALSVLGHEPLGLDLDRAMVDSARRSYPHCEFRVMDLVDIPDLARVSEMDASFDAAICLGNVLPHLTADALPGFLSSLAELLPSGAAWILQTVNFDPILSRGEHVFPLLRFEEDGLSFARSYLDITPERLRFVTALQKADAMLFRGEVELYPCDSATLTRLHEDAGFTLVEHWSDFQGGPFEATRDSGSVYLFRRG